MGKLKKYQTSGIQAQVMPTLTDAPIQESLSTNKRVNQFLSEIGQTFNEKANVYATEQAVKDAITNPITKEQLDQARQTGGNPIDKFLKGGTTYNEAIKDVLGQQVSGELRLELDQISADVLEQVRTGDIKNQAQALEKLQEPISAHVEFLTSLDPKIAEGYGAQATASVRNYFSQADKIIRSKEEDKRLINAETMLVNLTRDYENFLLANPNADQAIKDEYKSVIENMAKDISFSLTAKQEALSMQLADSLENADVNYHIKSLAQKNKGKTINEVIDSLPKDESVAASYYMQSTDKESFKSKLNKELTYINSAVVARDKIAKRHLNTLNTLYIQKGNRIPPAEIKRMYDLLEPGSSLKEEIDLLVKQSNEVDELNSTSLIDVKEELDKLNSIAIADNEDLSIEEVYRRDLLIPYVKNMTKALNADPVGLVGKRDGGLEEFDLNDPDLSSKVLQRKQLIKRNADKYGINEIDEDMMIFTQSEINSFVNTYMKGDSETRVAMLQIIDNNFGDDNSAALVQLVNGGLPTTAELSSYFNDPILTSKFISFDEEDEQKRLETVVKERGYNVSDFRSEISNELSSFENIILANTPFSNRSIATQKLSNIKDALTYLAIHEMQTGNLTLGSAVGKAAETFMSKFNLQDTYYVPELYNGVGIDSNDIVTKAERIRDIHLADFKAVPYGSFNEIIDEEERDLEFRTQLVERGKWQVTADGTGLIYGIGMEDGSFGPIQNAEGNFLTFKFNDTTQVVPYTNVDITVPDTETVIERRGKKTRARDELLMSADDKRRRDARLERAGKTYGVGRRK